ncbi:YfbU family protein [Methylobacterium sp. J-048]|uniref:YfbU family protein n=1 Tax=Methylobacterium sp. J-048 TaxID=2836635 RepID=UPI001FBAEA2A|nr:YfbU family protein [Methylobacterium sp. J-048]MCJ2059818.1 YfbU family protein [Methylobacterium sp. J-048]
MKLSNGERLIVALLCDISKKLDARHEIDPEFVMRSLGTHEWGLSWEYSGLFDQEDAPPLVRETCDILDMWRALEQAYAALPDADRARVDAALGGADPVRFGGFDGNHNDHHGIAHHLIEAMGRYQHFKGHYMNSHTQTSLPEYKAMLRRFDRKAFHGDPSADRIIAVMGGPRSA